MSRIPPEIDDLLWAVAESSNYETADEFLKRYPQYAGELARRRSMVTGLKRRKPSEHRAETPVPRFKPRNRPAPMPRGTLIAVGSLVLAAVAVGAYTVTAMLTPAPAAKVQPKPIKPVATVYPPIKKEEPRAISPEAPKEEPNPPSQAEENNTLVPPPVGTVSFEVHGADLESSLVLLGEEARVSVIVAPGMPKTLIDASYKNLPLERILLDLGEKYGFTPFDQGDGSIIIVPAKAQDSVDKPPLPSEPEHGSGV